MHEAKHKVQITHQGPNLASIGRRPGKVDYELEALTSSEVLSCGLLYVSRECDCFHRRLFVTGTGMMLNLLE